MNPDIIEWRDFYRGKNKVVFGYIDYVAVFTIYEDLNGYFCLQGYDKYKNVFSRHLDERGAKDKAENRVKWRS